MQQSEHQPSAPLPTITPVPTATAVFDPQSITRPDHRLQTYYLILGAISGIIPLFPLLAKFHTLQYRFDDEGVSMKWGLLFRHEVHLTYRRIQDIHLTRNLLQRWLAQGRTVIAAVHDLALARAHFSHALLLDTRLVAAGQAAETLSDANIDLAYRRRMPVLGVRP